MLLYGRAAAIACVISVAMERVRKEVGSCMMSCTIQKLDSLSSMCATLHVTEILLVMQFLIS